MNKRSVGKSVLKQSKPRLWLGALRDMIQRTQSYYAIINVCLLLVTTYTVRELTIKKYIPGFNFLWLLAALAVFVVVVSLIDYKFIYPSQIAFHQHEAWKHRSPVRKDMGRMKKEIRDIHNEVRKLSGEKPLPELTEEGEELDGR